jgi:hypothetical protein
MIATLTLDLVDNENGNTGMSSRGITFIQRFIIISLIGSQFIGVDRKPETIIT